jgi:hypothetical protein
MCPVAQDDLDPLAMVTSDTEVSTGHVPVSHVDPAPAPAPTHALVARLTAYVARVGLLAAATNLGVARHTLERALGGLRVIRAIERQLLEVLDRDDAARSASATTNEGPAT